MKTISEKFKLKSGIALKKLIGIIVILLLLACTFFYFAFSQNRAIKEILENIFNLKSIKIDISMSGEKTNEKDPPNPDKERFEHIEGDIKTGYVIKDKNTGNEFVWVPVEKNQKIKINVKSKEEDITEIKLYDPLGIEIKLDLPENIGKSYSNLEIEPTINGRYNVEVKTTNTAETKYLDVRSLYAKYVYNDYYEEKYNDKYLLTDEWFNEVKKYYNNAENREILYQRMGVATDEEFIKKSKEMHSPVFLLRTKMGIYEDKTSYKDSIDKNGGFYIGRYEAGAIITRTKANVEETAEQIIQTNGKPVCIANMPPYNFVTQSQAKELTESMYNSEDFTCTLLTGSAWDRMLGWLIETKDKSLNQIFEDSTSWGNYNTSEFKLTKGKYSEDYGINYNDIYGQYEKLKGSNILFSTGIEPNRNVSNRIYDISGNIFEWTQESYLAKDVLRGGSCAHTGLDKRKCKL